MKLTLTTITLCLLSLGAIAQLEVPVPYNPDGNADGFITLPDLLDFLALYGGEYSPEALATDSSSAIIHMGQGDYFDCASWCAGLEGNWKVMDEILVGRYKDQIQTMTSNNATWMDRRSNNGMSYQYVPTLQPDNWSVAQSGFNADRECICQTRVIQPIVIQSGPCQGNVDLCGICDGPGPVYECGCFEIPEGACDCEGNQLDALGECGGNCLGDFDGDGVCDSFAGGPCANEEAILYHGVIYELVEIGDQCWFVDDLRTEHFQNGDSIPNLTINSAWVDASSSSEIAMSFHPTYGYNGAVYNWFSVNDPRGLCPSGWHVPSREEYQLLGGYVASLNGPESSVGNIAFINSSLKDDQTWNGTNLVGFRGRITIQRSSSNGTWDSTPDDHISWTSTFGVPGSSYYFRLTNSNTISGGSTTYQSQSQTNQGQGYSIRCIKDAE